MSKRLNFLLATLTLLLPSVPAAWAAGTKDTLTVAFETKPKSVDPRLVGGDANSQYLEELLFLPLISFDDRGGLKPVLAESYAPEGKLAFKVKLRKGMKFANGKDITVDDVIATYSYVTSPTSNPPSPRKGAFAKLTSIKKTGANEIVFTLSAPDAAFLTNLNIGILPQEGVKAEPDKVFGQGYESGPFIATKTADDEWILQSNSKYTAAPHGGAKPKLAAVHFKMISDSGTRFSALVKGDVDLIQNSLDADKVVEVQKNYSSKFKVTTGTALSTTYLAFNFRDPVFKKPEVRKAIAMGINRDEILRYSLQGLGIKAKGMFPPGNPFEEKSLEEIGYNPAEAKKLLVAALGNKPLTMTIKVTTQKERIAVAKAIAGQLKRIGVTAEVQALESSTFSKQLADGLVQTWIAPWTGFKDGDHLRFVFHSKQVPPEGANRGAYSNAKVDELLDKGVEELVLTKRLPHYAEAQKILAVDLPYVYLWHKLNHVVTANNVKGFQLYSDGRYVSLTQVSKE